MVILAADIGGSQARLLLGECEGEGAGWRELRRETLPSREFAGIDALLQHFLRPGERPQAACLALAGPVHGQRVRMTNLPWTVDATALAALKPADFRLAPGSPGKGKGEGGKDLGADVDLVGPGEAYEKWKKTREYEEWRKKNDALMAKPDGATP